jgi:predicted RNA-binding protein with RPS1 domain
LKTQKYEEFFLSFVQPISNIPSVYLAYLGNKKWQIKFDSLKCPFYEIGQDYKIKLLERSNNGFCIAETEDGIKVRVLEPFNEEVEGIEGIVLKYYYWGVDNSGFLEFRQRIEFKDVIESKALKVIAFDNIRKEYTNTENYEKLFGHYDAKNNLWVLSYGNSLQEVIDDKIKNKEWDSTYLLLEVLEKIERWILNSGYLNSFSYEQKERIKQSAEIIINKTKFFYLAISSLIEEDFSIIYNDLNTLYDQDSRNYVEIALNINAINKVFQINNIFFPKDFFKILQLIKECYEQDNELINRAYSNLIQTIHNVYDKKQQKIYRPVFINPVKRRKYFNENIEIKNCILLVIWLMKVDIDNKDTYYLKLLRHFAYYNNNITEQKKLINKGIHYVYSQNIGKIYNFDDFNLLNGDITDIMKFILIENNLGVNSKDLSRFQNSFGYIFFIDSKNIFVPYTKNNIDGNDLAKNINIIAFDESKKLGLGSNYINYTSPFSNKIEQGEIVKGIIKNIVSFGIFINLGGNQDGLLHSSKISHNPTSQLNKIFNIGDEIVTKISSISDEGIELDRIPILDEMSNDTKYNVGETVEGIVYRMDNKHGVYIELNNGSKGYIPIKEFFYNEPNIDLEPFVEIGEKVTGVVLQYDKNKGYRVSVKKNYENNVEIGGSYTAKVITLYDFKVQISRRLKISPSEILVKYCPKCQKKHYSTNSNEDTFLEFYSNNKKWRCQYCDYKSQERLVLRLKDVPIIANYFIDESLTLSNLDLLLGKEVKIIVKDINSQNFVKVEIVSNIDIREVNKNPYISVQACIEIGYLYEQLASITEKNKEALINMCRYYFGFAKSARSYFHSSLNDYNNYLTSLSKLSINEIKDIPTQANSLRKEINSEEAIINFPILEHLLDTLLILSSIDKGLEDIEELLILYNDRKDNIELLEIVKLAIALRTIPNKHIKSDIWEDLKSSLINNLRLIQKDELDKESISLRRLINNIVKNDLESDVIECKGSYLIPIPNKKQLKRIYDLKNKLLAVSNNDKINSINEEIHLLNTPKITKELKDIVTISWIKTIAAFANSKGGELFVGIGEDKDGKLQLLGMDKDLKYFKTEDDLLVNFDNQFQQYIGNQHQWLVNTKIVNMDGGKKIFYIKVKESPKPIIVKKGKEEIFYIRREASTSQLSFSEYTEYHNVRFFNNQGGSK